MIAAWKVPSTLYVVWASMGMAKRRVAKSVRIEGDDLRDILVLYVNVRCGDDSSSYQLSSGRTASQTEDAKGVGVVEGCGVRLDNGRWCLHQSVLCGEINVEYSECLQRQITNVIRMRSQVRWSEWCNRKQSRCGWIDRYRIATAATGNTDG